MTEILLFYCKHLTWNLDVLASVVKLKKTLNKVVILL